MAVRVEINLNENSLRTASAIERYLEIGRRLHAAGFEFEPIDDLFPGAIEIKQPWHMSISASGIVTYTQQKAGG